MTEKSKFINDQTKTFLTGLQTVSSQAKMLEDQKQTDGRVAKMEIEVTGIEEHLSLQDAEIDEHKKFLYVQKNKLERAEKDLAAVWSQLRLLAHDTERKLKQTWTFLLLATLAFTVAWEIWTRWLK